MIPLPFAAWSPDKFASSSPRRIFGLMGLPKLLISGCLVVVTSREQVAKLRGSPIWRVSAAEVVPLRTTFADVRPLYRPAPTHCHPFLSVRFHETPSTGYQPALTPLGLLTPLAPLIVSAHARSHSHRMCVRESRLVPCRRPQRML